VFSHLKVDSHVITKTDKRKGKGENGNGIKAVFGARQRIAVREVTSKTNAQASLPSIIPVYSKLFARGYMLSHFRHSLAQDVRLWPLDLGLRTLDFECVALRSCRVVRRNTHKINHSRAHSCPVVGCGTARPNIRRSAFGVGCSMFRGSGKGPRYIPWRPISNPPESRIGIPCRCLPNGGLSIVCEDF